MLAATANKELFMFAAVLYAAAFMFAGYRWVRSEQQYFRLHSEATDGPPRASARGGLSAPTGRAIADLFRRQSDAQLEAARMRVHRRFWVAAAVMVLGAPVPVLVAFSGI